MANIIHLVSEEAYAEKMDAQNTLLASLLWEKGNFEITAWDEVQKVVRFGLAPYLFSVGDQLVCARDGEELTWDVVGFDCDTPTDAQYKHSMTLQLHDACGASPFDADAFADGMDADFLAALGRVTKYTESGGTITERVELFFLPSRSEVYGAADTDEGTPYPYYRAFSDADAPHDGADGARVKYCAGTAVPWQTRSCTADGTALAVSEVGAIGEVAANAVGYAAPMCCVV